VLQADEDRAMSTELAHRLGLEARCLIDDDLNPDELKNLYGTCRMVISSRLHAVLLSLVAGVPAISVAPEVTFKERAVLDLLGLDSLWIPSSTAADLALEKCLDIASRERELRLAVASAVSNARTQWAEIPHELRRAADRHATEHFEWRLKVQRPTS
jgi:polysaccharide pyruvyl transferase WcaK-like protein